MVDNRSNFLEDATIEIRVITQADRKRVYDFLAMYFFPEEPLTYGSEPRDLIVVGEDFLLSNIDYGMCLMAVLKDTNELVGLTMTGPKGPEDADHMQVEADAEGNTKWGNILRFLVQIERESNVFERYTVPKVLNVMATCVDVKMRGRNLGSRLYSAAIDMAKAKGFEVVTADCTSFYSARIKDRLGWDLINVIYYKDFLDANNKQIFCPDPPHECCKTYAVRI
ncbi:arylalkylamine N-acetyltransferase-like 2 [Haematobia irritans]|uniref:arylalkylamine N-acetyltransferase-like 2 n=1 Tax=Haematobia irritans TaxID=7368 RepID=UPI003F5001C1